jgi:aspartyl aminopeptidase
MKAVKEMMKMLSTSYSTFHVVENIKGKLLEKGFIQLHENEHYDLESGKDYFVTRNDTSVIAFRIPSHLKDLHMQITATHNDSPTFKLKPNPVKKSFNLMLLNVEPYGGGIYNTWLDKPLSIAGRVYVKEDGKITSNLLNINEDLLVIPNVCIHMNRTINSGYNYNPAVDMLPVMGEWEENFDFHKYLLKKLGKKKGDIYSFDLFLYNREKPTLIGRNKELLSSGREDDLTATYSTLLGFLDSQSEDHISVFASFDNEEVGSLTKQGANSTFLKDNLQRIVSALGHEKDDFHSAMAGSFMLSIDNAHANHPNHPELSDKTTLVQLNKGIVIKYNANQSYTSDALSSSVVKDLCHEAGINYQEYTNRSDLRGGSTLGNLSEAEVSITTVDIGIAQLAMHSSYETLGVKDIEDMVLLTKNFFSRNILMDGSDISID